MIPIAKPSLDEREADAARRVILSGWITQGLEDRSWYLLIPGALAFVSKKNQYG
jgi:hypothetical protein